MAVPPTVADLDAEVTQRCGLVLADAGLFLRALDGSNPVTPVVRQGLRRGAKAVGSTLSDPMKLQDSDVAGCSQFALERVLDEAELFALQMCLARWWQVTRGHKEATSTSLKGDGWLEDQRQSAKNRVAELKAECDRPYREPTDPMVVTNPALPAAHRYWPYLGDGTCGWEGYS